MPLKDVGLQRKKEEGPSQLCKRREEVRRDSNACCKLAHLPLELQGVVAREEAELELRRGIRRPAL